MNKWAQSRTDIRTKVDIPVSSAVAIRIIGLGYMSVDMPWVQSMSTMWLREAVKAVQPKLTHSNLLV